MPEISVIIPVYNTELYLPDCIKSIVDQSYQDWEICLIDDGSDENAANLCDSYAEKDHRIRVLHGNNVGLAAAREKGLQIARGKFVVFIDSDDYVENNFLEVLRKGFESEENIDVSVVGILDKYKTHEVNNLDYISGEISYNELFRLSLLGLIPGSMCCRMYRKESIAHIPFSRGRNYEDMFYTASGVGKIHRASINLLPLYIYNHRADSITTSRFTEAALDCIYAAEFSLQVAKETQEETLIAAAEFKKLWAKFNVLDRLIWVRDEYPYLYKRLIRDLRSNWYQTITCPHFQPTRKLASCALLVSDKLYIALVKLQQKRIMHSEP